MFSLEPPQGGRPPCLPPESGLDAAHVQRELHRRDRLDRSRTTSPLRPADDAVVIDTTELSIDEVVDRVVAALDTPTQGAPAE